MLWFLHLACRQEWVVERYLDDAVGVLDKTWMSRVTLRPRALHERAHEKCFIANSVKSEVVVEPC